MIEERKVTRYRPSCETCGWWGDAYFRRSYAERDLTSHTCGEHRQAHDSTGGYRGVLGGYNVRCVCGERWITDGGEPFACPRAVQDTEGKET